jgi:sn-glycerol 3-phosphate transport system ATP-binding protein
MATVGLEAVEKRFGQTAVLHGVSCAIADGEFVVIVGPSGCGKSTLLRIVAGLEQATSGRVTIGDRPVDHLAPKDRDIAMVFQNYALYPHMSVFENMAYGLKIRGLPSGDIRARVDKAAAVLQLAPYLDRKPRELSGGQRQRVAMGRAIVREPAAFLFDEPLSNLDAKLRVSMRVEIRKLQRDLGVTSIYVTHDQVEAMTLADRLVVMNAGRAEQIGAPMDIYERPATAYVAGFIGSPPMNLLAAQGGDNEIILGEARFAWPGAPRGPVTIGLRPEHLHLDPNGPLRIEVDLIEALGADSILYGRLPDNDVVPLLVRVPGSTPIRLGDRLHLSPDPGSVHLFDATTGHRLD